MAAFQPNARWQWPNEDAFREEHAHPPGTFEDEVQDSEEQQRADQDEENTNDGNPPPQFQRHYPPRTCRICLEEVLPSFEPLTGGIPSILHPAPNVKYVSSDASSGRLIRPCKCRGSQKYVHEGCLQDWRHADPAYGRRNFWECPTCKFRYRLERMRWSRYISSTATQIVITVAIMFATVFLFGFVADPIINLYLDPYDTITSLPSGVKPVIPFEEDDGSWTAHFIKGLASLGMLGFVKVFFVLGPWQWFNIRNGGVFGGRRRRGGRDRLEDISWTVVIIGMVTFLAAVWTWVRAWTAKTLESAGERVADVQGEDDDFEVLYEPTASQAAAGTSTGTDASGAAEASTAANEPASPGTSERETWKTK